MGRTFPVLVALAAGGLAGCAQLAGIDDTTGLVPPDRVSLAAEHLSIGATLVRAPQDLTGHGATYYVPDATQPDGLQHVAAELLTPDTWSAAIPEGAYPIEFELPEVPVTMRRMFDFPQRNIYGLYGVLEHPAPRPAPMGAMMTVQAMLPSAVVAGESFQLYSVGTWIVRPFGAAEGPPVGATTLGPFAFPYASASSITGRPLEQITTDDAVLLLRYVGNKLTGVLSAAPFTQTTADTVSGTMQPVAVNQMLDIMVGPPAAVAARYAPARPAIPNVQMAWYLHAAPGAELASDTGPLLDAVGVAPTDTGKITVPYGNPFATRGWPTVLTWSTNAYRTITPAGQTLPINLYGGLFQVATPTPGLALDLPAGLPEVITLDGQSLSTDNLTIPKPTKAITVSFVPGIPNQTMYQLQLFELVPNTANTSLVQKIVFGASGSKPEFTLPPDVLVVGKRYQFRAICVQGSFPAIADGDLRMRSLPLALGYLDGGVFTVTP